MELHGGPLRTLGETDDVSDFCAAALLRQFQRRGLSPLVIAVVLLGIRVANDDKEPRNAECAVHLKIDISSETGSPPTT